MTDELTQAEAEAALHELLDKHQRWVMSQPQMLLLWPLGRATRRRVAELLAKELLTIPHRVFDENTPPNREMRRAMIQELNRVNPRWWEEGAL